METRKIKLFDEGGDQWAARFNCIDNIDIDVVVTRVNFGYVTNINVARAEYPEGIVLCDSLDQFDVYIKSSEASGAASVINRNHLKLKTAGKPQQLTIYKFQFDIIYEGS